MTQTQTFPRSQHWTTDGFRITVLVYKSHRGDRCATCGERGAIHSVWADRKTDGYSASPTGFCDTHRPAKGTLPSLDYTRHYQSGAFWTTESLAPTAKWPCGMCGAPGRFWDQLTCRDCNEPEHLVAYSNKVITMHGERTESGIRHEQHNMLETHECDEHRLPGPGVEPCHMCHYLVSLDAAYDLDGKVTCDRCAVQRHGDYADKFLIANQPGGLTRWRNTEP